MFWQENKSEAPFVVPDAIVDVVYHIQCQCLRVDHVWDLSQAVAAALPWFTDEPAAGLHPIHVAESGNGWMRPEQPDALLYPSRRTRLMLRLPKGRVEDAGRLAGQTLDVGGNPMRIEKAVSRPLSAITTLFSRYLVTREGTDESAFLREAQSQLAAMGIRPKKMLCGIERVISTPGRRIHTRSLMLTEMTPQESVLLQQQGLGPGRTLGCGLFVPHKDIREVQPVLD